MKKLCIFLTDPMKAFYEKGEIKPRYYNPCNYFDEIHMISFCNNDIEEEKVKIVAGDARLKIYSVGELSIFSFPALRKQVLNLVKRIGPDVIRAYDPSLRGTLAVYSGKRLNISTIISVHSHLEEQRNFDMRIILWFRIFLEYYSLRNASKVICVSNYVKSYAYKYGARDVTVVYNRVALEQFCPHPETKSGIGERKVLLSVGRLDKEKYQECLIEAIKDLNVKLILIGNGRLYGHLNKLVKKLSLEDKVVFIKSVSHDQIQDYYLSADIFVLSSHYEGFCIPIIEAMASGLPIVASNLPAITEIVNGCGLLCKNKPADFKEKIEALLKNPELRSNLSQKAKERSRVFDYKALEKQEAEIYKNLIFNIR